MFGAPGGPMHDARRRAWSYGLLEVHGLLAASLGLVACSGSANPAASNLDSGSVPPGSGGDGSTAADVGTVDPDASAHESGADGSPFDASTPPSDGGVAPSDGAVTDGGSWVPDAGANVTVLFAQPSLPGIAGNFFVQKQPAVGAFALILWQTNPDTADGGTVPVSWDAGDNTGFYPPQPASTYQTGFKDVYGTTAGQIAGDTVGAYLNSSDLASSKDDKEMITPHAKFAAPYAVPFANAANILSGSLELQVPVAENGQSTATEKSNTYANVDLLFATSNAADPLITFDVGLFGNGMVNPTDNIGMDDVTENIELSAPISSTSQWLTPGPLSVDHQHVAWKGWKTFQFTVDSAQFALGLAAAHAQYPTVSTDAAAYRLTDIHLNAELHYGAAPAQLGWSMRHLLVTLQAP
jgi:hypothetical protein